MSKIDIAWEIDGGQITAEESVVAMIDVIQSKNIEHTGTFWTWENEVSWTTIPSVVNRGLVNWCTCAGIPVVIVDFTAVECLPSMEMGG
jgi:hypothetical protein